MVRTAPAAPEPPGRAESSVSAAHGSITEGVRASDAEAVRTADAEGGARAKLGSGPPRVGPRGSGAE